MLASLERAPGSRARFVGDASHELRTPLTALRGNAAYLARHGADAAASPTSQAGAERLSDLLDDLLALAREDAAAPLHPEPVRLADLADDAVIEQDAWVEGERDALARAVDNLVRNAHKHGTGEVTMTVGGDDSDAFIAVRTKARARRPDRIFERFRQAARGRGKARASACRSSRRSPSATAAGSRSRLALYARCQRTLKVRP